TALTILPLAAALALWLAPDAHGSPRDGDLDAAFGDGGIALVDIGPVAAARAIAAMPDGRIVVAGQSEDPAGTSGTDIAVAMLTAEGRLDAGFGDGGRVLLPIGSGPAMQAANNLIVQRDGRIVVVANGAPNQGEDQDFLVVRLNA